MSADTLGFVVAVGLPLAVIIGSIFWLEPTSRDRTVEAIRQPVQDKDSTT